MKPTLGLLVALLVLPHPELYSDIVLSFDSQSTKASELFEQAEGLVQQGEIDKARDVLLKLDAESNQYHSELVLAELLLQNNQPLKARATMERFSAVAGPRFDLFLAYAKLAARDGRWFDAFVQAQLASNQPMPDNWSEDFKKENQVELDRLLIRSVAARGNWAHARELASKYPIARETDTQILELAAQAEFYLNRPREALEIYKLLADVKQDGIDPLLPVAKLYESTGNNQRAERFYSKAVEAVPLNAMSVLEFARWLVWQNRAAEALSELQKLSSAVEYGKERDYLLALAHRQQNHETAARQLLEPLYEADPKSFAISNQLCLVLIESADGSDHARALELALANVEANRANSEAWSTLGWIQLNMNQIDAARESLAVASQAGQVSRDTAYFLSQLRLKLGESEASQALLQQAEQADGPFFYAGR